jgi:arylsulfatase A-like enzyme
VKLPPSLVRSLTALALLASCGAEEPLPRFVALARGFRPEPLLPLARAWQAAAGLDPEACREEPWSVHVREPLPPAAWRRGAVDGGGGGLWTTPLPGGAFTHGSAHFMLLRSERTEFTPGAKNAALPVNGFRIAAEGIELRLSPEATPPEDLALTLRLESGRLPADGVWQVRVGGEFGAGLAVWSGRAEELVCDVPPASRLGFRARFAPGSGGPGGSGDPLTLRVLLDGEPVHVSRTPAAVLAEEGLEVSVVLPRAARRGAHLRFEVEGPLGQLVLLRPLLGPAEIGAPGARPWETPGEARPDLVLLLADTFRADGLEFWGGAPELAPRLNELARRSLRFRNARSNAAWTLPSISTLLTGLAPGQHTANESGSVLPDALVTIAESLSRAGYRTCAVTDAAFFTPTKGLEQGFESFVMNQPTSWDLDWTVARAREFLARDDGRPLFLLVHTYRVHMPYRVGPEEDLGPWRALLASGCALLKEKGRIPREEWRARLERCRERYTELYRDGVRDLDRGFGELLAELERTDFAARGHVLFTSDHGEALGENQDIFHDGKLWESKLRIPLLLAGPGLVPRDVEPAVSLLDVAPTLAALAGLAREPRWPGSSLLGPTGQGLTEERPSAAFLLKKGSEIALLADGKKLLAPDLAAFERGAPGEAFDLALDPGEEHPVADAAWPAELARRYAGLLGTLLEPATPAVSVPLTDAQQRELGNLGYGGDDDVDDEDDED